MTASRGSRGEELLRETVNEAVFAGLKETDSLEELVEAALHQMNDSVSRLRVWDSRSDGSIASYAGLAGDTARDIGDHFSRQRAVLGTYNVAFFGRTGAGKSTLISAFGHPNGERVCSEKATGR